MLERIYSQEFNLISPNSGLVKWILGAYWQKDTLTFPPKEFVIGVPPGNPASEYVLDGTNPKKTSAAFGKVGFDLSKQLELEKALGGRHTRSSTSNDVNVVQYGLPLKDIQTAEYNNFSGKAALNFKLDDKQFLYAFAASGFRPGGLNVPVGLGIPAPFDAEKVISYELGLKSIWANGHLRTQLTAFHNNYKNFQVIIGYPTFPTFGFELNVPDTTKISGFEAQVQGDLGDWKFDAGLGIMHSEPGPFLRRRSEDHHDRPMRSDGRTGEHQLSGPGGKGPDLRARPHLQRRRATRLPCRQRHHHGAHQLRARLGAVGHLVPGRSLGDRIGSRNVSMGRSPGCIRATCGRCTEPTSPTSTMSRRSTPACASPASRANSDCA